MPHDPSAGLCAAPRSERSEITHTGHIAQKQIVRELAFVFWSQLVFF